MRTDRRSFVAAGLAAAWTVGRSESTSAADPMPGPKCLDYGRSFICNTAAFNAVRFWVESRTTLIDGDRRLEFYQCGSCKSENTFAEKDLFHADNYDFLPILGEAQWLIFRRTARLNPGYRMIAPFERVWGPPVLKLREAAKVTVLDTWDMIRDATAAGQPIVSQTELFNPDTGLRAIIECPVKTMNVSLNKKLYQVDTGPVGFPDLTKKYDPSVDCLRLAFVAFNAPNFADFIVEQPTPVIEDGQERCQVHHYSSPFSLPAKNVLLAVGD